MSIPAGLTRRTAISVTEEGASHARHGDRQGEGTQPARAPRGAQELNLTAQEPRSHQTRHVHSTRSYLMQTAPHINFKGNCREALNFYAETLGGRIVFAMTYGEAPGSENAPAEVRRQIIHARVDF